MNVYTQVMILYTSYVVINKIGTSLKFTKYLLTFPYYVYTLPSKMAEKPINTLSLNEVTNNTDCLIITKRPDFFSLNFYFEKDDEDLDFENIKVETKEQEPLLHNISIQKKIKKIDKYYIIQFDKIIVDSHKLNIFELKIIYDTIFFFMDFKEFLRIIRIHKIIAVNAKTSEVLKFIQ